MLAAFGEVDRLFGDLLRNVSVRPLPAARVQRAHAPTTTFDEREDAFELRVEVPGMAKEDLELRVEEGVLALSGRRSVEPPEGARAIRRERRDLSFSRRLRVPRGVDLERISARMADGVLTLTLPKRPEDKPRSIEIAG